MGHQKGLLTLTILAIILINCICAIPTTGEEDGVPVITDFQPTEGSKIGNNTPVISATFLDDEIIKTENVTIYIDDIDVTAWELTQIDQNGFTYTTPEILALKDGNHTVRVVLTDQKANTVVANWTFIVDSNLTQATTTGEQDVGIFVIYAIVISGLGGLAYVVYILYLRKTKRFTYKKYFARKPLQKKYLIVYLPLIVALIVLLFGFLLITSDETIVPFAEFYLIIIVLFIALTPYAIDSQREKKKLNNFERAFAQFLFELADAIRGGIDPAKAVIEFAKVDRSVMRKHIKVAADGIKLGRPFEEMLGVMVTPMKSKLIKRYSSLIGESSKIGGDISVVIHRAAQDMDELIKIEEERRRQLMMQSATIYIAFGVLLIIIWQLVSIYPSLGNINMSGLQTTGLESDGSGTTSSPTRMSFETMKERFFEVALIVGICSGTLIGVLSEGKPKMGLIHVLVMSLVATIFFAIMIFPL